jgi:hypothetical protein
MRSYLKLPSPPNVYSIKEINNMRIFKCKDCGRYIECLLRCGERHHCNFCDECLSKRFNEELIEFDCNRIITINEAVAYEL